MVRRRVERNELRDFEMLARHRARAVGGIEDDRENRRENDGGKPRAAGIAEPERDQRQHDDHRHGVEEIDVEPQDAIRHNAAADQEADQRAEHNRDRKPFRHRRERDAGCGQEGRIDDHAWDCQQHGRWLGDIGGRERPHDEFPQPQYHEAGEDARQHVVDARIRRRLSEPCGCADVDAAHVSFASARSGSRCSGRSGSARRRAGR